jgi:hypothetical protein
MRTPNDSIAVAAFAGRQCSRPEQFFRSPLGGRIVSNSLEQLCPQDIRFGSSPAFDYSRV